jgi:hypothetical protein
MGDFGIGEIAALVSALGAAAGAGTGIAGALNRPGTPKLPTPAAQDTTQFAKALLPGTKADAAARTGGGLSPDFLSNLVDQNTGTPGAGLNILEDIKKSLGNQGA